MDLRAARLKRRILEAPYEICIERARYVTEAWRRTEGTPPAHRVAEAEARVAEAGTLRMDVRPSGLPASRDVLVMEDVRYAPPGSGRPLLQGVSLRVRGPDRVAVAGRNGSGKSTLLRLVAGELAPEEGAVRLCVPGTRVVWLGQDGKMRPAGALQTPSARPALWPVRPAARQT